MECFLIGNFRMFVKMKLCFILTVLVVSALQVISSLDTEDGEKHIICYYGTWATYRPGEGKFDVEDIRGGLCTHLVYAFVGINDEGYVISLDPYLDLPDDGGHNNFGKFNALKEKHDVKTILAVGGWSEGSAKYSIMAADSTLRSNFVTSALDLLLTHGFDGFDLDWEYPNRRDSVHGEADIDNFTQLIRELKEQFRNHSLILSAAVSSIEEAAVQSYDIPAICELLDIVGIMTYDMYGGWDNVTGHNAPLHKGEGDDDTPPEDLNTVDVAIEYWLSQGCSPKKIVMGLPAYARTFNLVDTEVNGVRAPSNGSGLAGPYTNEAGFIGYNELCVMLGSDTWDMRYDPLAKVPYAVQGHNWVSYDDPESLTLKINWGLQRNISGFMIWSIETDDFRGNCGEHCPLMEGINFAIAEFEYQEEVEEDGGEEEEVEEDGGEEEEVEEGDEKEEVDLEEDGASSIQASYTVLTLVTILMLMPLNFF